MEINRWAIREHKGLVKSVVVTIFEEIKNVVTSNAPSKILQSENDAHALASRFRGVLYRHPYFKKKHIRILHSIIDRCGEAYSEKKSDKLYISEKVLNEWAHVFQIPTERIREYVFPLVTFNILSNSNRPGYVYVVSDTFFNLVGPVARHLVMTVDPSKFAEMMGVVNGLASIYVVGSGTRRELQVPTIPSFLKLSMIYTLAGLNTSHGDIRIDGVLKIRRIDAVDNHFVIELQKPVELWRSIRTEAFEFMTSNKVIERPATDGYSLNMLWVKAHEEGVRRYVQRLKERYERAYGWQW